MKKEPWQKATAGLGILCLAVFACMPVHPACAQTAEQVELTSFSGEVKVLLSGAGDFADAQEGMTLESGDQITAAAGSSAEVSFNEENTNLIRLNENTSVRISLSGEEKLEMTQGEVFASINSLPEGTAFEIRTPTAISGARGTDWITNVSGEGTDVEAIDDEPYVRHMDETTGTFSAEMTRIQPGRMTTVRKFQKPSDFRPIAPERRQHWQAMKHDLRKRGNDAMQKRITRPRFDRKEFLERRNRRNTPGDGNYPQMERKRPPAAEDRRQFNEKRSPAGPTPAATEKKSPPPGMKKPPNSHNQPGAPHDRAAAPSPRKTVPRKTPGHADGARR